MSSLTSVLALKALDGLTSRAEAISQNIANANTTGYRPIKVTFEDALQQAADLGIQAIEAVEPRIEPDINPSESTGVRLDLQIANSSITSARYSALISILSLQIQHSRTALGN